MEKFKIFLSVILFFALFLTQSQGYIIKEEIFGFPEALDLFENVKIGNEDIDVEGKTFKKASRIVVPEKKANVWDFCNINAQLSHAPERL